VTPWRILSKPVFYTLLDDECTIQLQRRLATGRHHQSVPLATATN
jgi:hypothetical protein